MKPSFLVVDKPAGVTSHDVVAVLRAVTGEKKVGHTGTLDPFATGVLALAFGGATRLMQFLDEEIKVYDARVRLGTATDTGDPTGEVVATADVPALDEATVQTVLRGFVGRREQRPPAYSAVKHKGRPLYWYARRGEEVEVAARPITVHEMRLVELGDGWLQVHISCSRGTYARVLAAEIAEALGTVGHLEALSRLRSGPFLLRDAIDLPTLARIVARDEDAPWQDVLLSRSRDKRLPWKPREEVRAALEPWLRRPLDALSHLPLLDVDGHEARRIRSGMPPSRLPPGVPLGGRFLVVLGDEVIAVAEASARGPRSIRIVGE